MGTGNCSEIKISPRSAMQEYQREYHDGLRGHCAITPQDRMIVTRRNRIFFIMVGTKEIDRAWPTSSE
jgi:hypothetical protein